MEHAPDIAEAAVGVVGTVLSGLAESLKSNCREGYSVRMSGGAKMKIRIGMLLLICVFLVSGVNAQTGEPTRADFGGDNIFSYAPPKGWKVMEFPGLKYKIARAEPVQGFAPNIVVTSEEYASLVHPIGAPQD